ncbi:outer membrane protein insertion porin family [Parelusimicrobium proximum]|uniref:outer membrane protein assembly factor BamA n=1 Tax=Parelusimicrobium proximum TaxID=3228953 RepID=UPI003D16D60C
MKKFFTFLLLTCAITGAYAEDVNPLGPWMVCEVSVSGNKNITPRTITKAATAKKGIFYEREDIYQDVKDIMALGSFNKVDVDISVTKGERKSKEEKDGELYPCHKITYIVAERPIVEKFTFEGRKKLSKNAILGAMTLKSKDPFNEAKLSSDMPRIEAKYAEKGYISAKASYETTFDEKLNIVNIKLILNEGARTRVEEVIIDGANNIPEKKLIKKSSNRPGKVYKPQNLPMDFAKMTLYGRNKGFSEYDLTQPQIKWNEDKSKVTLVYEVKEGTEAAFGTTTFDGNTVFTDEELKKAIFYRTGKIYNQNDFDSTVRTMQEEYANKGYLNARINPIRTVDDQGNLNIDFEITENNVFYVDHVDVYGNETTKSNVLEREVTIKPGDRFSYDKIRRTQTKLMNLRFLNDVQLEMSPTNDPNKVDLGFHVVEGRPGMFTAGVAMSSLDGLYGEVSISHTNLFGKAQSISLRTMFGKDVLDYTVSWSTPWTFDRPTSFGVDLFRTKRHRPYRTESGAYYERRTGGRVRVGPRFSDDIYYLGLFYSLQEIRTFDVDDVFKAEIPNQTDIMSSVGVNFSKDTRDNIWDPSSGWVNSIGLELSGGPLMGDLDIWSMTLKSVFNHTVLNIGGNYPLVFVFSNRFGTNQPYGDTDKLPVYERYFLGGADTVRGYKNTGQIGPEDGAKNYYIMNAELRLPLAREGRRNIAQIALFADIGNSWNDISDVSFGLGSRESDFKAGVGLGLRFTTPQLPIRIDWGYGLNHPKGEDRTHFYFNMSNAF